ncbi:MAG: LPS export ABC transporter permease LptF [Deltaproteobacteria bacterium]|nr:LPS export ABC transporter permease LptF [Deltaproteobacteria bacterium]
MSRILSRYLILEILHPFAVSLLGFTIIVFSGRVVRLAEMIVVRGVGFTEIVRACFYLLPYLLVFTLPMAATVGIILGLIRLSVDMEIIAMKSSGLSFSQLMRPVLAFALAASAATLFLTVYGAPWARHQTQLLLTDVVKRRADLGIQEQTFNKDFPGLMIYVHKVAGPRGEMDGIFIYDKRDRENPHTIYAKYGKLDYDQGQEALVLQLNEGRVIRWSPDAHRQQTVEFKNYKLPVNLFDLNLKESKSEKEMTLAELVQSFGSTKPGTQEHNRVRVELNQRFAMPIGAFLLCLLAVPLGMSPEQHGRVWGLIMGLAVFLIYYVIFTASWRLGVQGRLNPALAPWLPNLLFLILVAYFWRRTTKELALVPSSLHFLRLPFWKRPR